MANACGTCKAEITNSDFILCNGSCRLRFHAKCASLTKTTLNAIVNCSNIYWYCIECNNGNKQILISMDTMKDDINAIKISLSQNPFESMKDDINSTMNSISQNLLSGFAMLTDKLATTLSSASSPLNRAESCTKQHPKRRREEDTAYSDRSLLTKKFVTCSNVSATASFAAVTNSTDAAVVAASTKTIDRRRSIVISNIGTNTLPEHIIDYLSGSLSIDRSLIRVNLLKPAGRSFSDLSYLQFRISLPDSMYTRAVSPNTWPVGVKIRDYVHTERKGTVSLDNFLVKNAGHKPMEEHTKPMDIIDLTSSVTPILPVVPVSSTLSTDRTNEQLEPFETLAQIPAPVAQLITCTPVPQSITLTPATQSTTLQSATQTPTMLSPLIPMTSQ
ncbi:uncharacterized protein LOC119079436 [Bradysia coprophila]|uniref:uncharacterized protein LOC119079436 n=1 Tax=Bradysia coprophila TaxID=38358 RepID=UPI00187DA060|nr:uncharacterized protein LOC119079436 [Bradysia coprophila]